MAYATVPVGRYYGWTAAQLNTRIAAIRTALVAEPVNVAGRQVITSVSGNGTSATFDPRAPGGATIERELEDLLIALALVDDDQPALHRDTTFAA